DRRGRKDHHQDRRLKPHVDRSLCRIEIRKVGQRPPAVQRPRRPPFRRAAQLRSRIGSVIPADDELRALAGRVAERLLAEGRMLVTAESCTAGWIGKVCTDWPGSSRWYRGGAVVYDDELKVTLLGVPAARPSTDGGGRAGAAP